MLTKRSWIFMTVFAVTFTFIVPTGGQAHAVPASQQGIILGLNAESGSFIDEVREACRSGKKRCAEHFFSQQGMQVIYINTQGHCARFKFRFGGIRFYGGGDFTGPEPFDGSQGYKTRCVHYAEFSYVQEGLPGST